MATAPVFAPDGTLGDIPVGNLPAALKAGFKPGVTMKSADGKLGVIPADRVLDASKSGLQIVPLKDQETQHPGFWSAIGSDISAMVPHSLDEAGKMAGKNLLRVSTLGASDLPEMVQSAKERMAAGHGAAYTAGAAANEALGVNVKGEEQAADEGDVAGVAGHAATVPAVMAVTAGLAKGADVISEHPAFVKASNAIKNVTPKQAAQVVGGVGGGVAGHGELSAPGAYYGAKAAGNVTESLLGKARANQPIFGKPATPVYPGAAFPEPADAALGRIPVNQPTPVEQSAGMASGAQSADINPKAQVYRDATRQNVPYAGELDEMTDRLAKQVAEKKGKSAPDQADHTQAAKVLDDSLKSSTEDVVDSAIPEENRAANLNTKAEVDFHLQRGDVGGAEQALDSAIKEHAPQYSEMFAQREGKVPSVMEIRQKVAAEQPNSPQDRLETKGIQEAMRENLDRHQWSAESEARREFIARNTTGWTKTWGSQAQRDAAHATAMASDSGDMTDLLQKSLQAAQEKKGQQ